MTSVTPACMVESLSYVLSDGKALANIDFFMSMWGAEAPIVEQMCVDLMIICSAAAVQEHNSRECDYKN